MARAHMHEHRNDGFRYKHQFDLHPLSLFLLARGEAVISIVHMLPQRKNDGNWVARWLRLDRG